MTEAPAPREDPIAALLRRYALTIVGAIGLFGVLYRYLTTGALEMPILTTFAGLLGFESLQNGRPA